MFSLLITQARITFPEMAIVIPRDRLIPPANYGLNAAAARSFPVMENGNKWSNAKMARDWWHSDGCQCVAGKLQLSRAMRIMSRGTSPTPLCFNITTGEKKIQRVVNLGEHKKGRKKFSTPTTIKTFTLILIFRFIITPRLRRRQLINSNFSEITFQSDCEPPKFRQQ